MRNKIVYIEAPLTTTPFAGKTITTTGTIVSWRELTSLDNTAVTTYTIPTNIDLIIDKIEKTTLDPEHLEIFWDFLLHIIIKAMFEHKISHLQL